jgi:N-acetylmuramoyl-L-alanine amidase
MFTQRVWRMARIRGLLFPAALFPCVVALGITPPKGPEQARRETAQKASAHRAPDARPALSSRGARLMAPEKAAIVVIDPGHPSERNDGKRVVNGISEVRACWLVARKLRGELEARGMRVVMTKSHESQFVANRERAETANRSRADLFLRLHCDAGFGRGFAVYYPDRRGRALGRTGPDERVIKSSRSAAAKLHSALARALSGHLQDNGIQGDSGTFVGRRQGALTGSIFSEVPVLTVEMCVLDSRADAAFIKSESGRAKMAAALADGVNAVVGKTGSRAMRQESSGRMRYHPLL